MSQTLDQKRAGFAWKQASNHVKEHGKDYVNLAKGAPALIMGNGLMAALAFYKSRDKKHATAVLTDIAGWIAQTKILDSVDAPGLPAAQARDPEAVLFAQIMHRLQHAKSVTYMRATDETLAMLKWLRQFADAVDTKAS
jgi:CRISPR-associated protein Cmr5